MKLPQKIKFDTKFDETYQLNILKLLYRSEIFLQRFYNRIKPDHFNSHLHQALSRILLEFYIEYKRQPTIEETKNQLISLYNDDTQKVIFDTLENIVDSIFNEEIPKQDYIESSIIEFIQKSELLELIWKTASNINDVSIDDILEDARYIKDIEAADDSLGTFSSGFKDFLLNFDNEEVGFDSCFVEMDKNMRGGIRPGELLVVLAPTGQGKSFFLINLCRGYVVSGCKVIYYTLEMAERDVMIRTIASMCNMPMARVERGDNISEIFEILDDYSSYTISNNFLIKEYGRRTASIDDIRSHLSRLKAEMNFVPDIICIDYADYIKPNRHYKEERHALRDIYQEIINLSRDLNTAVITASQTNSSGDKNDYDPVKKVRMNKAFIPQTFQFSEAFSKAMMADYVIGISNKVVINTWPRDTTFVLAEFVKNRHGPRKAQVFLKCKFGSTWMETFDPQEDNFVDDYEASSNDKSLSGII